MGKLVAIGDLHGHLEEFEDLLDKMMARDIDFEKDTLVFVGDYVDGGLQSAQLVSYLQELHKSYPHWVFLKGNHDQMFINASRNRLDFGTFAHWFRQGGCATARSYDPSIDKDDLRTKLLDENFWDSPRVQRDLAWLDSLPLTHETERFVFVHAGLNPGQTIETTSEEDKLWIRERFYNSGYDFGKIVVYGHTFHPIIRITMKQNAASPKDMSCIGIDTMNRQYGCLTAVVLNDDRSEDKYPVVTAIQSTEIPDPYRVETFIIDE